MRGRDVAIIAVAIVVVLVILGLVGGGWMMGPGMVGWGGYGVWPWWGVLMMVLMVLFWALIIGGVVWLVLWLIRQGPASLGEPPAGPRPLDIIKERYARGEITGEQYEQMRHDLEEK